MRELLVPAESITLTPYTELVTKVFNTGILNEIKCATTARWGVFEGARILASAAS